MKKSVVAQIIYAIILIAIAVVVGIFLYNILEKNKKVIEKNVFEEYNDIAAFFDQKVQDPDYFYFYLTSNGQRQINVTYYDVDLNLKKSKVYYVDGFLKVEENLSQIFGVSSSNLDNTQVEVLIQTQGTPKLFEGTVLLKVAKRVLIVNTNIVSYLKADLTYDLIPPTKVIYVYNDINSIEWFDPYWRESKDLSYSLEKVLKVNFTEDYNTYTDTITFKDSATGDPIVNAKVYVNSFFVGYTDSNGQINIKYHQYYDGYLKLVSKCYYYSEDHNFFWTSETIYVDSNC